MPATRVRRRHPGARSSRRASAMAGFSGPVGGSGARSRGRRPRRGVAKRGRLDPPGSGRGSRVSVRGACRRSSRTAGRCRPRVGARRRRRGGPRIGGGTSRWVRGRSEGGRCHPRPGLRDEGRFLEDPGPDGRARVYGLQGVGPGLRCRRRLISRPICRRKPQQSDERAALRRADQVIDPREWTLLRLQAEAEDHERSPRPALPDEGRFPSAIFRVKLILFARGSPRSRAREVSAGGTRRRGRAPRRLGAGPRPLGPPPSRTPVQRGR
jgi:hypothetical protein